MRIATYTRISTDEEHQPYSLGAQATRLRAYVTSQEDWVLTKEYTDQASGATNERPGLSAALAAAQAGRFDLLLVYRVDRLARSVRGLATLLETLDAANIAFRSATEPFDTTSPAGRMMVQMLGVFAEFERATIIDRVIAGMERKAARGEWTVGGRPLGYTVDPGTGRLVVSEREALLVQAIFDRYVNGDLGLKAVATWLNERGHRTRTGRPWNHMAVLTVLRNRVYLGEISFRGIGHTDCHATLVKNATFEAAQAILAARGEDRSHRSGNAGDYLLAGLVICDQCGRRYVGCAAHGNKYRYRYYSCFSRHRYGGDECAADRLPADEIDENVLRAVLVALEDDDLLEEAFRATRTHAEALHGRQGAERAKLDADITAAERAIDRYLLAFEAGSLPEAQCGERIRALSEKIGELAERRSQLDDACAEAELPLPNDEELAELRTKVRDAIESGELAPKKGLLRALVQEVRVIDREHITAYIRVRPNTEGVEPCPIDNGTKVRPLSGLVAGVGFEPTTFGL
jgi:site-specific DNA recombinase